MKGILFWTSYLAKGIFFEILVQPQRKFFMKPTFIDNRSVNDRKSTY